MPLIIDGHNLIGKMSGIRLSDIDDEEQIISRLLDYCNAIQQSAEIYFDNAPPGHSRKKRFGRVTAFFVLRGRTADDAIKRRLAQLGRQARNWTVVSSDRQVQAEARSRRARLTTSEEFADRLNTYRTESLESGENNYSDQEIQDWLDLFDQGSNPDN